MGFRHRPLPTLVLLAALVALPALDAVCLAACGPDSAGVGAALPADDAASACHDAAGSEARLVASASTACGEHSQVASDADAALRPSRDDAAPRPVPDRIPAAMPLVVKSPTADRLGPVATLPPGSLHASISSVLRI